MATSTNPPRYKLVFTVPPSSLEACKSAIFAKGKSIQSPSSSVHNHFPKESKSRFEDHFTTLFLNKTNFFKTGAGSYPDGNYSMVSFETRGTGQFMPCAGAHPHTGTVGELCRLEETRVEVLCVGRDVVVGAVDALKR